MHLLIIQEEMSRIGQLRKESHRDGFRIEWVNHLNSMLLAASHREILNRAEGPVPVVDAQILRLYLQEVCNKQSEIIVFIAQDIDLSGLEELEVIEVDSTNLSPGLSVFQSI